MPSKVPEPEDYDISPQHGFLPHRLPKISSLDSYYEPWINIAQSLPQLLNRKRLRAIVDSIPTLTCDRLKTTDQLQCAYSMLAFICHAYIWGGDSPAAVRISLSHT
jgi:indoleamine 2,3-dioxygenase